jgi:hypothetical protein
VSLEQPVRWNARTWTSLAVVLLVAVGLRIVFFQQAKQTPSFGELLVDSEAYDRAARGILDGSWPWSPTSWLDSTPFSGSNPRR